MKELECSRTRDHMKYRPEIDGLRAVAVLPVILYHAGFTLFSGGYVGVDIFFVISGYLITTILLKEIGDGSYSIVKFYERRIRRIIPALAFVSMLSTLLAMLLLSPMALKAFSESLASVFTFVSNIYFWRSGGYFDISSEFKPLLHTWSLSVEEQFYMLFPFFLVIVYRVRKSWLFPAMLILFVASLVFSEVSLHLDPSASYYLLPSRGWELMLGSLVAYAHIYRESIPRAFQLTSPSRIVAEFWSLSGLGLVVFSVFFYEESTPFPGLYALVPVIGTALVIMFADRNTWVGRVLSIKLFVSIGLISYSAYLFHQPVFAFARVLVPSKLGGGFMLCLSVLSLLLGYLSWRFVEKPFREKDVFTRKQIFVGFAIVSALLFCLGMAGALGSDMLSKQKYSQEQLQLFATAKPSPKRNSCHAHGKSYAPPELACEYGGKEISWAVLGDSHVIEFGWALSQKLSTHGIGLKHLSHSLCAPFSPDMGAPETDCQKWTKDAVDYLVANSEIHTVVINYRINAYLYGLHERFYPGLPNTVSENDRERVWAAYVDLLRLLLAHGKHVVLVLQAPEVSRPMEDLIDRNHRVNGEIVSVPRGWWNSRNSYVAAHIGDLPKDLLIVNPTEIFCDDRYCYASRGGKSIYFDDDHVSVTGGEYIAEEILKLALP